MPPLHSLQLSPFQRHVNEWNRCQRCPLHLVRQKVVLCRGVLPCDLLFVGEAPGLSEDVLGSPFVGPAGHLMDRIVDRALDKWQVPGTSGVAYNSIRYAFTNLIACIPLLEEGGKADKPPDESIEACKPRLIQFVEIARPRLIIQVGLLAEDWLTPGFKYSVKLPLMYRTAKRIPMVAVEHPSSIIRKPMSHQGLATQRAIVVIKNAVLEHLNA